MPPESRKSLAIKVLVIFLIAVICGVLTGVLFSLFFYGFVPRHMLADVLASDTSVKAKWRFWIAFIAGVIFGLVWAYRIFKDTDLR